MHKLNTNVHYCIVHKRNLTYGKWRLQKVLNLYACTHNQVVVHANINCMLAGGQFIVTDYPNFYLCIACKLSNS